MLMRSKEGLRVEGGAGASWKHMYLGARTPSPAGLGRCTPQESESPVLFQEGKLKGLSRSRWRRDSTPGLEDTDS